MKNTLVKKSSLNITFSIIYKLLAMVVSFIVPRLFILHYGSDVNGLQGSVAQIFTYIGLVEAGVGDASLQALYKPMATRDYDGVNGIIAATSRYYNKIAVVYFGLLVAAAAIYPLVVEVAGASNSTVFFYILCYGAVTGINFLYLSKIYILLKASGEIYIMTIIFTLTYLLSTAIKIAVILLYANIVWIQAGYLLVNLCFTYVCYRYAKKHFDWINFKTAPNNEAVRKKGYVFVHNVNYMVFSSLDIVLLTFLCDLRIVSVYTTYRMIIIALTGVINPFIEGINFVLGQKVNSEDQEGYCRLIDSVNVYYSAFAFSLFAVMYILMLPFMRLYTKGITDFNYIYTWLPILYLAIEMLTIGRESMNRTITNAGHFKETYKQALAETIINIVVSTAAILLLKHAFGAMYGLYGALIGTVAAMLYRTVFIDIYANKKILKRSVWGTFRIWISNIFIFGVVAVVSSFFELRIDNFYIFLLYGAGLSIIMLVLFVSLNSLINPKEFRYVKGFVLEKLRARKVGE